MKRLAITWATVAWLPLLIVASGCGRETAPPPAISADQLPSAIEKTFAKAKPELKQPAGQVVELLRASDYPKAYVGLQNLAGKPGLSKDQRNVTASALFTVNGLLQAAQSQGDARAATTLKYIRENK